ncbi:MAG: diadenylate cyclase CdaA [Acidobacteriota bacterium]
MSRVITLLHLNEFSLMSLLDIVILAIIIYQLLLLIRGTRNVQMLIGIVFMIIMYFITGSGGIIELKTVHNVLGYILFYIPLAIIVLFQNPIRRALISLGRNPLSRLNITAEEKKSLDEIVLAAASMASKRIGALIILEKSVGLRNFAETGILLDANISYDLLMNIFSPNTPLHDGAVIIGEGKIKAASCYLPLTLNPELSKDFGTRHRAGIGITEETDALAIIISEERGVISLACEGRILEDLDAKGLKELLLEHLQTRPEKVKRRESEIMETADEA